MALKRAKEIGASSFQIFVKNNMQWSGKAPSQSDLEAYARGLAETNIRWVFGHAGYLINLGAGPSENRTRSIASLIQEIQFATALKLPFLVMHPGAHLGAGETAGLKFIANGLDEVFGATKSSPVRVALENTAGQGSCLGAELRHFGAIYERSRNPERLAICMDTAHLFAAGYDVRSPKGWRAAVGEIEGSVRIEEIVAFHMNDSKTELGSRVDRHAHIGQGHIGLEGFRHIVNDERFKNHPACLETPKGKDLKEDIENLGVLRSLVTRKRARN